MGVLGSVLSLIAEYGYLIVFFGVMLESAGVPIPGETILIAAGILAQQGRIDVGDAILFGILGAVVGDQIGYCVGREGGRPFVLRWGRYVLITPERLAHAERFFERHGGKAIFFARFVAGLRVFGALVAGISHMHWRTFFFYNSLGGAVWATAVVLVGYLLGGSLDLAERWMGRASILLGILLVVGLVLYLAYRWISTHPEKVRRTAARLGGGRLQTFLASPVGLWLLRRFAPGEVYGLAFTVGLLFTGLFSWAFGGIVQDLLSRDPLVDVDLAVLRFVYSHGDPDLTTVVVVFEAVFSPEVLLLAGAVVGGLLLLLGWRRREPQNLFSGIVLLAAAFGTGVLIELFKFLFDRPRPPTSLQLVPETGLGFPSGHAMAALVIGAAAVYVLSLRRPEHWGGSWRAKVRIGLVVFALVFLVGLGRIYMGSHYPSDVLAGWALGGIWASLCLTAAEVLRKLREIKAEGGAG
jgi:membrane protein DedA with SNARE-associated domain